MPILDCGGYTVGVQITDPLHGVRFAWVRGEVDEEDGEAFIDYELAGSPDMDGTSAVELTVRVTRSGMAPDDVPEETFTVGPVSSDLRHRGSHRIDVPEPEYTCGVDGCDFAHDDVDSMRNHAVAAHNDPQAWNPHGGGARPPHPNDFPVAEPKEDSYSGPGEEVPESPSSLTRPDKGAVAFEGNRLGGPGSKPPLAAFLWAAGTAVVVVGAVLALPVVAWSGVALVIAGIFVAVRHVIWSGDAGGEDEDSLPTEDARDAYRATIEASEPDPRAYQDPLDEELEALLEAES